MSMKQDKYSDLLSRIDSVSDPYNRLSEIFVKARPKLALDITPTTQHDPCHDLFRIYTFKLLKELSKKFEIFLVYRDIQASLDIPVEESKRLIQESISLFHGGKVPFKVYYESEILQKHLVEMPEKFFKHLYKNILSKQHNHFDRHLMFSSASLSVLIPLLDVLKVDVLLCMEEEKENVELLHKIYNTKSEYFPVVFYRTLKDLQNKNHSPSDKVRAFPRVGWSDKAIYRSFKKYHTNVETFYDWYKKLGLLENKIFDFKKKKLSFEEIYQLTKNKKISSEKVYKIIANHIFNFTNIEGKFLELASKELKVNLKGTTSNKVLSCLNTPSRIKIIDILDKSNLPAYEIAKQINISLPTTLFHLTKLQEAGIIVRNKNKSYSLKTNRFILYV